jgi:hypothetical protein
MPPELTNYQVSLCVSFICPVHIPGGGSLPPCAIFLYTRSREFKDCTGGASANHTTLCLPPSHSTYMWFSLYPSYQLHPETPPAMGMALTNLGLGERVEHENGLNCATVLCLFVLGESLFVLCSYSWGQIDSKASQFKAHNHHHPNLQTYTQPPSLARLSRAYYRHVGRDGSRRFYAR